MSGSVPSAAGARVACRPRSESPPPAPGDALAPGPGPERAQASWRVRPATGEDVPAVAAAVGELLRELGGTRPSVPAMEAAARELVYDRHAGALFVADAGGAGDGAGAMGADGAIVGVLAASWQSAMHVPGRYALIQDLWVHPSWRGGGVGAGLLAALFALARERGFSRVEVGLPGERFAGLAATEAFYLARGFTSLGLRMRRGLA
jgi:GNAT superfamily N-acetyltransferase